jgi:hypothetical protein
MARAHAPCFLVTIVGKDSEGAFVNDKEVLVQDQVNTMQGLQELGTESFLQPPIRV